ncbi:hypothetical protein BEH75_15620 [Citrobacter freundii]|nr:hypothetical protein CUC47_17980 [Citrobacter freundii]AYY44000.1 hypothetical protein EGY10_08635 [Citrobacter freundii]OIZ58090.1 hypothetical protein BEH75_15620 [Citrobacter freundii]
MCGYPFSIPQYVSMIYFKWIFLNHEQYYIRQFLHQLKLQLTIFFECNKLIIKINVFVFIIHMIYKIIF